jgi:RNA polymerase primary sigma factor
VKHTHEDGRVCDEIHTLEEIGKELGITRERVRQIEQNALRKLRKNPKAQELFRQFVRKSA